MYYCTESSPNPETTFSLMVNILKIAIPAIITLFSAFYVELINVSFVGHLGDPAKVAGVGLGNMYMNITFLGIAFGLNTALATFVSHSYGQGNLKMCGEFLNKSRVVLLIAMIPLIFL